jgi:hypothetical protein
MTWFLKTCQTLGFLPISLGVALRYLFDPPSCLLESLAVSHISD